MAAVGTINGKNSKTENLHVRKYLDLYLLFVNLFILCDSNTVLRHLSENKHWERVLLFTLSEDAEIRTAYHGPKLSHP
jgi:hypothetical protein